MKINIITLSAVILIMFCNISCITATRDSLYNDALGDIKSGNIDFAYIKLSSYLKDNPNSVKDKKIRFAIAEYLFQTQNYRDALYKLAEYINDYPEDTSAIFAQVLLYKVLLEYKQEPEKIKNIKERFFSKSLLLIFSESKTKYYKSLLNNTYKIIDYIDKIEIFKNNEPFLIVTP